MSPQSSDSQIKNNSVWIDSVPDTKQCPALKGSLEADVVIIGGGIVGLLTAWNCSRLGKRVILLEKNRSIQKMTRNTRTGNMRCGNGQRRKELLMKQQQ